MNKLTRLAPIVLLLFAGCDLWLPDGDDGENDEPEPAELVGRWNGALTSGDPLLSNVTCEGEPVNTAALRFTLTSPSEGEPDDALGGFGRLELRAGPHTCITLEGYVSEFGYDYPDVRIEFGPNFALEGELSERPQHEGQFRIYGALWVGETEISVFGMLREIQ